MPLLKLTEYLQINALKRSMKTSEIIAFGFLLSAFFACDQGTSKTLDSPTQGEISVSIDDSYTPIMEAELYAFHSFYKYAKIHAQYKPEGEAVKDLLNDSARLVVMSRELTDNEKSVFEKINLHPKSLKIAYDAVAIIVHPANKDTMLTMSKLKAIISGSDSTWKQVNNKSSLGKISIVFDHKNSGNARFIQEKFLQQNPFPKNCFAAKSNKEVVDYVAANKDAIGVIGVNWISDKDDTLMLGFLKKIKVVALASSDAAEMPYDYYQPYQAYIQQGTYPLCRNVYIVSREARAGLGTGFAAFVAGDKGQRIILKSGLVPATAPIRIINIK
jgi:phosphate transport system substrate-binding protein